MKTNEQRKGAAHLANRKISTFPFRNFLLWNWEISPHACSSQLKYFSPFLIYFPLSYVAFSINIGYCHIFHVQMLLHTFSISSLCKPTLLYHSFYISVLLHWDCVEMWLYRVDCMPSLLLSAAVSYSLTKLSWKFHGRVRPTLLRA